MPDGMDSKKHSGITQAAMEKLLTYGDMCIEAQAGIRFLNRYLHEMALVASGVPYAELGIGERRRESSAVRVFHPDTQEQSDDRGLLRNETLTKPGSIAILKLSGVMTSQDDISSYGVGYLESQLRAAYSNGNIGAVILDTNSPGGEVTAMQMLVNAVQDRNKPVLGFGYFAASAAYGTLAATDEIIAADKMSQFGSVGAVITLDKAFLEFFQENFIEFYGADAPLKNNAWRQAQAGNFAPLQSLADEATRKFQAQVAKMRPLTGGETYQRTTLSGDMFDAADARRRGLVDGIGTMNYAISRAAAWMGKNKKKKAA